MKEEDVRDALHTYLRDNLKDKYFTSLIIDELGVLEGSFRVDMAVIHKEELHGFEIKSASDNLKRLPSQQENYCKVFDRMTLVCDQKHVAEEEEGGAAVADRYLAPDRERIGVWIWANCLLERAIAVTLRND